MSAIRIIMLLLLLHGSTYAGWVITEESTDSFGNSLIQTTFIQNNLIRHETPTSVAIIDLNNKIITMIFPQHKLYWTGTTDELKVSSIEAYDLQMKKLLAGLPPYERNKLESIYLKIKQQMFDSSYSAICSKIEIKETDDKQEILGFNTIKYNVLVDSIVTESIWHTTDIQPYNDIDINSMITFMQQLNPAKEKSSVTQTDEYLHLLKSGILLKSIEFLPDSNKQEISVKNIREINIVPDFFLPPKNYRKAALSDILNYMPDNADIELNR
ncbi:MAG: hypothetical protein H8E34_03120 [Bacteroidetes bacterium]|nr:hypothetical protein [Bacteroidota bacterium]MBL6942926.1 hypothetical protein [Bacteroidales bacterium]